MRVLLYDIECTANIGDTWAKWQTDVIHFRRDWYMLCFAFKWLDEKKTYVYALPDFATYRKDQTDDTELMQKLRDLMDEADIVVGHNSNAFDNKMSQTRMIVNDIPPPSPYKQLDTKVIAKRAFRFTSNKLDDLARFFNIPGKLETGGYGLWLGCENNDPKAWAKMKKYNRQDVVLLEQVYKKMIPWTANHPPMNTDVDACPRCGTLGRMVKRGFQYTKTNTYQRVRCGKCKGWSRMRNAEKTEKPNFV